MLIGAGIGVPFRCNTAAAAVGIAFDAASTGIRSGSGATLTWAHTVGGGAHRILVVRPTWNNYAARTVTGVTFNSVALTKVASSTVTGTTIGGSGGWGAEIWYLIAPPSGTFNIVVTFDGDIASPAGGADSWIGVDQATPFRAAATTSGTTEATATLSGITSAVGDVVVGALMTDGPASSTSSNDSERWEIEDLANYDGVGNGSSKAGAAVSTALSWARRNFGQWGATAAALKPG